MAPVRKTVKLALLTFVATAFPLLAKTYNVDLTLEVKDKYFLKSFEKRVKITLRNNTPEEIGVNPRGPSDQNGHINLKIKHQGKTLPLRKSFRGERIYTRSLFTLKPDKEYIAEWNLFSFFNFNNVGKYRIQTTFKRKDLRPSKEILQDKGIEDIDKWREDHPPDKFTGKSDWHEFRIVKNTRRTEQVEKIKKRLSSGQPSAVASALKNLRKHPEYHFRQDELNKKLFMLLNSDNYEIRKLAYMYLFRARDINNLDYFEMHKDRMFDKYESTVDVQKFKKMILNSVNSEDFELRLTTARALDGNAVWHYLESWEMYQKIPHKKWFHREDSEKIRILLVGWLDGLTIRDKKEICRFLEEIVHNQNVAGRVRKKALDALIRKNRFEGYRVGLKISNDDSKFVYTNGADKKVKTTLGAWAKERCKGIAEDYSGSGPEVKEVREKLKKIRKEVLGEE